MTQCPRTQTLAGRPRILFSDDGIVRQLLAWLSRSSPIAGMRLSLDSFRFLATAIAGGPLGATRLVRYLIFFGFHWSRRRDLNPRPSDYKADVAGIPAP
jgi:hypothetical protein